MAEVYPEPRSTQSPDYDASLSAHSFNHFLPWEMNEDGTEEEEAKGPEPASKHAADTSMRVRTSAGPLVRGPGVRELVERSGLAECRTCGRADLRTCGLADRGLADRGIAE